MVETENRRFVITGGPGFGKSTLIGELERSGFLVFQDVARRLIESGMQAPIWSEDSRKGTFFRQIYEERLSDYLKCPPQKTGFFDRGLPDSIAYTRFMRLKVPDHLIVSVKSRPYNPKVFFTPVWPEIFSNDAIRREDLKTASELHQLLQEVYEELGYTIIELPKADVATRIGIILDTVKRSIEQQSDR